MGDVFANRKKKKVIPGVTDEGKKTRSQVGKTVPESPKFKRMGPGPSKGGYTTNPAPKAPEGPKMSNASNGPKSRPRPETKVPISGPKTRAPKAAAAASEKSSGMSFNGAPGQNSKRQQSGVEYNKPNSKTKSLTHNAGQDASHTKKPLPATAHKGGTAEDLLKRSRYNGTGGLTSDRRK